MHVLVKWVDFPNSEATWVNINRMWNFFRVAMKLFNDESKNR